MFATSCSFAQKKTVSSQKTPPAILLDAVSQTTYPGVQGAEPTTNYEFSLIWRKQQTPIAIFWRNGDAWTTTQIFKVTRKNRAADQDAIQTEINPSELKMGDSIIIFPLYGGKYKMPTEVETSKNKTALFFQMNKTNWTNIAIKKFTKRPDILMP